MVGARSSLAAPMGRRSLRTVHRTVVVVDGRHLPPTGRAGLAWRAIMASSAAARGRGSSRSMSNPGSFAFAEATRREEQQEFVQWASGEEISARWPMETARRGWPLAATKGYPICSPLKRKTAPKGDNRWVDNEGGGR
jgi:hypothetical protein